MLGTVWPEERNNTLLVLWRAWHHHNDIIHGKGQATIWGSLEFLRSYGCSLNLAGQVHPQGISEKGKEKVREGTAKEPWFQEARTGNDGQQAKWRPPPAGWAKVNTDVGYCQDTCMASIGAVVRDVHGNVLIVMASWRTSANVASAEEAEALACLDGIRLAVEEVHLPTEFETDCYTLVQAMNGEGRLRARWSGLIEEIKGCSHMLSGCKVAHGRRESNQVTHGLAQLAKKKRQCMKMHENVP
jgi:hypothetical protein